MTDPTRDALFAGALSLRQPARGQGYRVNVDALLLAGFAARVLTGSNAAPRRAPVRHAVDLGAGVGAVGLALLHLGAARNVTMIEVDERLAALARMNVADNGWEGVIDVTVGDVDGVRALEGGDADLVVCNPPYVAPGRGRPPLEEVRRARYGELGAFVAAARRLAGRRARVCFVYPAAPSLSLASALARAGLHPKRIRPVHGRHHDDARVVLVEAAPGKPGGLAIEPAFVERDGSRPSDALAALLASPRRG
jgi:tRNA1Val (adenine37-N6)-methyltransferase